MEDKNASITDAAQNTYTTAKRQNRVADTLFSIAFFLFFRISSWLCSIPMWLTLILHFTAGLSLWWFWGTLAAWLLAGLIRYAVICSARTLSAGIDDYRENKNPYSNK